MRAAAVALLLACGSPRAAEPVPQPLPPSPVSSAGAASREPDRAEVLAFCERYRHVLELRDADAIIALASPRYLDDGVTYAALAGQIHRIFAEATTIRYEIHYKDVTARGDGTTTVDYTYSASFLMKDGWRHKVGEGQFVLERRGDSFAILSGM